MPHLSQLAAATVAALLAAGTLHAQQVHSVRPAPSTSPSASARAAQAAPNPAGLRAPFPAGLTSGSGAAVSTDPIAANNSVTRGNAAGIAPGEGTGTGGNAAPGGGFAGTGGVSNNNNGADLAGNVPGTNVLGAGAAGLMARGPSESVPLGSSGLNPVEVARSFIGADRNGDGELTRGEAQRLSMANLSFEEMDRDFDGIITRAEYGDGMR